uniref:Cupin superfamily (DUF985) n=1 Tax=Candidatus Kentrum sp. SD TaxID=2126332 RepID=A0A450YZ04_9GAMM|nr:MAG: Cupin superfamily (DUF985) [Candidatus Kentron sp. SD]VFK50111.1 MAG: Cupin superfamily (DUF985) [Candidatus Kentron sp. SD]
MRRNTHLIVHPDGTLEKKLLGADPEKGWQLQLLVKGGCWKASVLQEGAFTMKQQPGFVGRVRRGAAVTRRFRCIFVGLRCANPTFYEAVQSQPPR